mmetsp:Transcript_6427/g.18135  ORF Transcript_6427/g.18135 Transcript_6427/m.18135 type:complete len:580 (+) Transcript_6427:351-2090(+)
MYSRKGEMNLEALPPSDDRWDPNCYDPDTLAELKGYCKEMREDKRRDNVHHRYENLDRATGYEPATLGAGGSFRNITAEIHKDVRKWLKFGHVRDPLDYDESLPPIAQSKLDETEAVSSWKRFKKKKRKKRTSTGTLDHIGPKSTDIDHGYLNKRLGIIDAERSVAAALDGRLLKEDIPEFLRGLPPDVIARYQRKVEGVGESKVARVNRIQTAPVKNEILGDYYEKQRDQRIQDALSSYHQEFAARREADAERELAEVPNMGALDAEEEMAKRYRAVGKQLRKKKQQIERERAKREKQRKKEIRRRNRMLKRGQEVGPPPTRPAEDENEIIFDMDEINEGERENILYDLVTACRTGNSHLFFEIISMGIQVEQSFQGRTFFMWTMLALLDYEDLKAQGKPLPTPDQFPARFEKILNYMHKKGADPDCLEDIEDHPGYRPIHYAAKYGNLRQVRKLMAWNVSVETKSYWGETPLHCAARNSQVETIAFLMESEANTFAADDAGNTVLHHAAEKANMHTVKFLLRCRCDKYMRNDKGQQPADVAQEKHRYAIADQILKYTVAQPGPVEIIKQLKRIHIGE